MSARRSRALACMLLCGGLPALQPLPAASAAPEPQPFTIVLDAAHGAWETGTQLGPQLLEKDLVLALSIHLRSALSARGMHVVTTRESDRNPLPAVRAAEANHARAGACLVLHATASGAGVHLYTSSSLAAGPPAATAATLTPWSSAGAAYATESLQLASEISTSLTAAGIPFTLGRVRMEAADAMRCPVVAVEVASLHPVQEGGRQTMAAVSDAAYQGQVVDALAAALLQWRGEHAAAHPAENGR